MVIDLESKEPSGRRKLTFVQFNPWEWASQNQVGEAFFRELGSQLLDETPDARDEAEALRVSLDELAATLGLVKIAAAVTVPTLTVLSPRLGAILAAGEKMARAVHEAVKDVCAETKPATNTEGSSVERAKAETKEKLLRYREHTGRTIVVVVDDIDRLSPDEIRQVLQLVKINADFPGLVFLLLYDKAHVVRSLKKHFPVDGGQFLEKIIQFELQLPPPPEGALLAELTEQMETRLLSHPEYLKLFEPHRVREAFGCWLYLHIHNPRKLGRLVSTWGFLLGVFDGDVAELNPVDLIILEAIRHFEPRVYHRLSRSAVDLFTVGNVVDLSEDNPAERKTPSRHAQLLNRIAESTVGTDRRHLAKLLSLLFPEDGRGVNFFDPKAHEALAERRICHVHYFRRYFRLSIDPGDISDGRMAALRASFVRPSIFFDFLTEMEAEGVLPLAFDKLRPGELEPHQQPVEFLAALWHWWERRLLSPVGKAGGLSPKELENRLLDIYRVVLGKREGAERIRLLKAAASAGTAVYCLTAVAFDEARRVHNTLSLPSDGLGLLTQDGLASEKRTVKRA